MILLHLHPEPHTSTTITTIDFIAVKSEQQEQSCSQAAKANSESNFDREFKRHHESLPSSCSLSDDGDVFTLVRRPHIRWFSTPEHRNTSSSSYIVHVSSTQSSPQSEHPRQQQWNRQHQHQLLERPHVRRDQCHPTAGVFEEIRRGGRRRMRQDLSPDQLFARILSGGKRTGHDHRHGEQYGRSGLTENVSSRNTSLPSLRTTSHIPRIVHLAKRSSWLCGIRQVRKNMTDFDRCRIPKRIFSLSVLPLTVPRR